jgi:hypothetical protein
MNGLNRIDVAAEPDPGFGGDTANLFRCEGCQNVPAVRDRRVDYGYIFFCTPNSCKEGAHYVELRDDEVAQHDITHTVGDNTLTCRFTIKPKARAANELFFAQALQGKITNRSVRTCTFLAVPNDEHAHRNFGRDVNHQVKTTFHSVKIRANNRYANTAVLPITVINRGKNAPAVPLTPGVDGGASAWTRVGDDDTSDTTLLTMSSNHPIRVASLYAVVMPAAQQ